MGLPRHGARGGHEGARGRGDRVRRDRAGLRRLLLRRQHRGQRGVYGLGLTGIPVINVNNNCSTGSTALFMARQAIRGGVADCVLALGFEKMERGSLGVKYTDRTNPIDKHALAMFALREPESSPPAPQMFGNAGREHMERYGSNARPLRLDRLEEPPSLGQQPVRPVPGRVHAGRDQAGRVIHDPLTKLQCSPTSDGSAAAVIASERFVDEHGLGDRAIEIAGQAMVTDLRSSIRGRELHQDRRLRHEPRGRRPRLRGGAGRPAGGPGRRAARLLLGQRAHHLRGARPRRGGPRPRARRRRGHHLWRPLGGQPVAAG